MRECGVPLQMAYTNALSYFTHSLHVKHLWDYIHHQLASYIHLKEMVLQHFIQISLICMMWCASLIKIKDVIVKFSSYLLPPFKHFPPCSPFDLYFRGNVFGLTFLEHGETILACLAKHTVRVYHATFLRVAVFLVVHSHFSDSRSWDLLIDLWVWHCHPSSLFFPPQNLPTRHSLFWELC